jgi:hypothetical protein
MIDRDTLRRQINSAQYRDRAIDEITDIAMRHIAAARAEALEEAANAIRTLAQSAAQGDKT